MPKKTVLGVRCLGIVVALALMFQFLQPGATLAQTPTITLNPTSGPVNTTVTVSGTGFKAMEQVTIAFAGNAAIATTNTNSAGAFTASFVVPTGTAAGPQTVRATGAGTSPDTATATFTVTAAGGGGSTSLQLSKTADGYTCGSATGCSATAGENITYRIAFNNIGTNPATGVTITDTLAPGQTFVSASAPCSSMTDASGITTVTCTLGTVPFTSPGNIGNVQIFTRLNGTQNEVDNTAYITAANANGGAPMASNTTYIRVGAACTAANNYCNSCTAANNYCGGCNTCSCGYNCNPCTTCTCGTCNNCGTCACGACNTCGTCACANTCNNCGTCACANTCNNCGTCACGACNNCGTCACGNTCGCTAYTGYCNTCSTAACNPCASNPGYCNGCANPAYCGYCGYAGCSYGTCGTTTCTQGCTASYCYGGCGTSYCNTGCGTSYCNTGCGTSYCNNNPCAFTCGSYGYTVCGMVASYIPASTSVSGNFQLDGITYGIPAGVSFYPTQVVNGQYYCFLKGAGTYVTGCLSALPTAVTWVGDAPPAALSRRVPLAV